MKRAPGMGTVVKLSGNRRKPYCAKITVSAHDEKQKQIIVGCFEDPRDAFLALDAYVLEQNGLDPTPAMSKEVRENRKRRKLNTEPTVDDLFEYVFETRYKLNSESNQKSMLTFYQKLKPLHKKQISTLTIMEVQDLFDRLKLDNSSYVMTKLKGILKLVFEEAIRRGIIKPSDDFIRYINATKKEFKKESKHKPFANGEIKRIMSDDSDAARMTMVYILTGCRPSELLNLSDDAFHLDGDFPYIITGSKTDAGRGRVIPIHPYIASYVAIFNKYKVSAQRFRVSFFAPLMESHKMQHTPYDTRHTFGSLARYFDMDPYCRKKIMGHKMKDLTDDVYTHSYIDKLYREICKIDLNQL